MADSTGHTKQQAIGKINKEALIALYDGEDIAKDYKNIRKRLDDPKISNRDFTALLKLVWDYTIEKPKQTFDGNLSLPIGSNPEQVKQVLDKYNVTERLQRRRGGNTN